MSQQGKGKGPKYHFWVDEVEYVVLEESISIGQIKQLAGVPEDIPLILLHQDGSEETLPDSYIIDLKPGRRFAKAPRFKRG